MKSVGDRVIAQKDITEIGAHDKVSKGSTGTISNIYFSKMTEDGLARTFPYDVRWDHNPNEACPVKRDEI